MDLKAIKNELQKFEKNKGSGKKKERKDIYFKPSIGKQNIRVVPNKHNPTLPFKEMKFYYDIGVRMMASPTNWGEKDPIEEFVKKLKNKKDKQSWFLAKKLEAKTRYFTTIIDRGNEDKVRLWQHGVLTYRDFLNLADDDEIGDYTDVAEGRDIKLTTVGPDVTGTDYNQTTISPSLKITPLSSDSEKVEEWLNNQPNILDEFKCPDYEYVKENLKTWLTEGEEEEEKEEEEVVEEESNEEALTDRLVAKKDFMDEVSAPSKSNVEDEWDQMFKNND